MGGGSLEDAGESTFVFGDTTFNAEHEEADIHPHHGYSGWACIRYGVGETLFRCSDSMELEPWLAESWELEDERTWKITLRDGITFSSGRPLDGQAVKACLEQLVQEHERAKNDLDIESIAADGQTVTIVTAEPRPALLSCLCDPYSCMVDLEAGGAEEGIVAGTGPYRAVSLESGEKLELVKNENYWNGEPGFDRVTVLNIDDGDTLTMALQAGEIDGNHCRRTAKKYNSSSAVKKLGMLFPTKLTPRIRSSVRRFCRTAARMPRGMEISRVSARETAVSSSMAGSLESSSGSTSRPET